MKKIIYIFILVFCSSFVDAQVIYEELASDRIEGTRGLKIQLPRNYDPESNKQYPLVIVLDGDYLFEPVTGNIDFQSYWDDMPDCIVVGIRQSETRENDFLYSNETYLPAHEGAGFFEFLGMDLIPFIENTYRASQFRIIVGHDLSANFINYYLFKEQPLFKSYIAMSPELASEMSTRLKERLSSMENDIFYYLSTSDGDIGKYEKSVLNCHQELKDIDNEKLHYNFDSFDEANHYTLVGRSLPVALSKIFAFYKPINGIEYREKLLKHEGSPYDYLIKKYENIKYYYGSDKTYIENDFRAVAAGSLKKNDMESLQKLSKLARKTYPESMISAYYSGMYFEEIGNYKKALQRYQSGLLLEKSQFIDKDILLEKMYELQDMDN